MCWDLFKIPLKLKERSKRTDPWKMIPVTCYYNSHVYIKVWLTDMKLTFHIFSLGSNVRTSLLELLTTNRHLKCDMEVPAVIFVRSHEQKMLLNTGSVFTLTVQLIKLLWTTCFSVKSQSVKKLLQVSNKWSGVESTVFPPWKAVEIKNKVTENK